MRTFLRRSRTVLRDRKMLAAYARWLANRPLGGPQLNVPWGSLASFNSFSEYWATLNGLPSTREFHFMQRAAGGARTVLDIGANIGAYTLLLARAAGHGTVYAFEPAPTTFAQLQANVARNRLTNVSCVQRAVSSESSAVELSFNPRTFSTNRLALGNRRQGDLLLRAESTTVDEFCSCHGIDRVEFMKVDVEGAEPLVLAGAEQMLRQRRIDCMLVEICPDNLEQVGSNTDDLEVCVRRLGYGLFRVSETGGLGERLRSPDLTSIVQKDVAIVPR